MNYEICFISPYQELTSLIKDMMPKFPEKALLEEGAIKNAEPVVKDAEKKGVEVIITTEGNKRHLEEITDLPIVAFPINTFDTVYAINKAKKIFGEPLALFEFRNPNSRFHEIKEIIGAKIEQQIYRDEKDGLNRLKDVKDRGIKAIVSGGVIAQIARKQGCPCIPISITEEAVLSAYQMAKDIAKAKQKERWQSQQLKAIVDYSIEGIISTDANNKVNVFNPAAERFFEIKAKDAIGMHIKDLIPQKAFQSLFLNREGVETDKICSVNQKQLLANVIPIYDRKVKLGSIVTFQKVSRIKSQEEKIRRENHQKGLIARHTFNDIVGESEEINKVINKSRKYALADETVLIRGETGTGKELFAQSIHNTSSRSAQPFVAVNCAALPPSLLESELFGYVEGAFTGAKKGGKTGLFELAHGGTVFLDEIGEIPTDIQSKLLRVLEQKEVMRIGDNKLIPIDVRVIAATNKELLKLEETGEFRLDLFYRISTLELFIPPLRHRKADILPLALKFVDESTDISPDTKSIVEKALKRNVQLLNKYDFPGNVRELNNLIKRFLVMVEFNHTKESIKEVGEMLRRVFSELESSTEQNTEDNDLFYVQLDGNLKKTVEQFESQLIAREYFRLKGNKSELAKKLGVGRTTLWRKLNEAGIE